MTFKERWQKEHPNAVFDYYAGCPFQSGYEDKSLAVDADGICLHKEISCKACWDREIPEEKVTEGALARAGKAALNIAENCRKATEAFTDMVGEIKDSGDRTQFESGAVRDMREGKGRCDLMPLEVVAKLPPCWDEWHREVILAIRRFQQDNLTRHLYDAISVFGARAYSDPQTMFLEVAKHYEEGAKKYGENNWQKGIPTWCYIDSAIRHYLKWLRGDNDEPHDRAFVWNLMCCIWEVDYRPKENKEE